MYGLQRPLAITWLALLNAFGAVALFGLAALMALAPAGSEAASGPARLVALAALAGVGVVYLITAIGLWGLRNYGRVCQMILSAIGILGIPIGTIIYGLVLYYLTRPGVKLLFSDPSALSMSHADRELINRDAHGGVATAISVIVGLFGAIITVGIVAAVALPSLLRGRVSANEAYALGSMRAMTSAQAAWASANGGLYAEPGCLADPASCGDTKATEPYLTAEAAALTPSHGFVYGFGLRRGASAVWPENPAPPSPGFDGENASQADIEREGARRRSEALDRAAASAAAAKGRYAYWAMPENPGESGRRRFCTDQTGVILAYAFDDETWVEPDPGQPTCPPDGEPVRGGP